MDRDEIAEMAAAADRVAEALKTASLQGVYTMPDEGRAPRRIAVVPAQNEAASIAGVLDKLSFLVDEVVVVDNGSTDGTAAEVEAWLAEHDDSRLLRLERRRSVSAAFHRAFCDLRQRLDEAELWPDDLVYTIAADGQHDLDVLDDLHRLAVDEELDALLVRRDLSSYPRYKRLGNRLLSGWASLWAGAALRDVASGYRIFRLGALVDALDYYRGVRYSETVEVAVVLSRLRYKVRNDIFVPVPMYRSRTGLLDLAIDLVAIPRAALSVIRRR